MRFWLSVVAASSSLAAALVVPLVLFGTDARAALRTQLHSAQNTYEVEYSQGITFAAWLTRADGVTPVPGDACQPGGVGQPCRVSFSIAADATPDDESLLLPEADPALSAAGHATKRVVFVDGAHPDLTFTASSDGVGYTITARFAGFGNPTDEECAPGAPEVDDGDLCPSSATVAVLLMSEVPAIVLTDGREGALGDVVQLSATVSDTNGDARLDSTDLDGAEEKLLEDVTVRFFYDADGDGRPDGNELIDEAQTNALGVAALDFTLDPQFVRAGDYATGIHAEFSGDEHYGVARASTRLIVRPADVDPAATILEVDPKEVPADGNSTVTLRARLVDEFNNLLDETSGPYDVEFKTTLGSLEGDVVQDPNNGSYRQTLRATREGGDATVTVFVDGVEGASAEVTFVREGCQCGHADLVAFGPVLAVLALLRRRDRKPPTR